MYTYGVLSCRVLLQYLASAHPYQFYPAPTSIIHAAPLPLTDNEHNSNTASPEEAYAYPPPKWTDPLPYAGKCS